MTISPHWLSIFLRRTISWLSSTCWSGVGRITSRITSSSWFVVLIWTQFIRMIQVSTMSTDAWAWYSNLWAISSQMIGRKASETSTRQKYVFKTIGILALYKNFLVVESTCSWTEGSFEGIFNTFVSGEWCVSRWCVHTWVYSSLGIKSTIRSWCRLRLFSWSSSWWRSRR